MLRSLADSNALLRVSLLAIFTDLDDCTRLRKVLHARRRHRLCMALNAFIA